VICLANDYFSSVQIPLLAWREGINQVERFGAVSLHLEYPCFGAYAGV